MIVIRNVVSFYWENFLIPEIFVEFEVLMEARMETSVFWVVEPCSVLL
jgi:hypothetical protein